MLVDRVPITLQAGRVGLDVGMRKFAEFNRVLQRFMKKGKCQSCHLPDAKLVGPSFLDVALKYEADPAARELLAQKIVSGGVGVWGPVPMPPNYTIDETEAAAILKYVFSLADTSSETQALQGQYLATVPAGGPQGMYVLRAVYRDQGDEIAPALAGQGIKVLRSPSLAVASADESNGVDIGRFGASVSDGAVLGFKDLDLTGVRSIQVGARAMSFGRHKGGTIEIRMGSASGPVVGSTEVAVQEPSNGRRGRGGGEAARPNNQAEDADAPRPRRRRRGGFAGPPKTIPIEAIAGRENLYLVFRNSEAEAGDTLMSVSSIALSKK